MNLIAVFLGLMAVTAYRSVPAQTDSSPYVTSIGERCNVHGVAVSQNLLKRWGGPLDYGDLLYVEHVGFKHINDVMNPRFKNRVDVWVPTQSDEKTFYKKYGTTKLKVWVIKINLGERNETVFMGKR